MERDYGWTYYGGKHFESRWTRFFQAYYLPVKFGFDKRLAHLSSLVVAGQMTREEACAEMEKPAYDEKLVAEDKQFIAKKLGITLQEFEDLIAQPNRDFSEFDNNQQLAVTCYSLLQKSRTFVARIQASVFRVNAYVRRALYFFFAYLRKAFYLLRSCVCKVLSLLLLPVRKLLGKR